jgi:hypothetical protein
MNFKETLRELKKHFKVFNNKELAKNLNITESAVNSWSRKQAIPEKYLKILDKNDNNTFHQSGTNNIGINNGQIHINSIDEMDIEICKAIKLLSPKRKEYYFYKIKAELLEKEY